ncbi:unnamed protein product [Effrenium voratum]|uniref:Uncharacterized protein n=1 Tax=Effrenium voratum TaxID=2562239 RepID=A0AA36JF88_9DINO|nr:unnamed protein product [Effrenium voratum]
MSAASTWSYATLHEMLMLHAARFLTPGQASWEGQVPFVARIVNASGTACGACDRRNCTGCLLPKGTARLRLRAGLFTGAPTAKIYLARLDMWKFANTGAFFSGHGRRIEMFCFPGELASILNQRKSSSNYFAWL